MSIILCSVDELGIIRENFVGFIPVEETTGAVLAAYVSTDLKENLRLGITDCRRQGYDNGANMKGHTSGLQARILAENPVAFFTQRGFHNSNLIIGDSATYCKRANLFVGTVQRLYNLLSGSPHQWTILLSKVSLTLKPLSSGR